MGLNWILVTVALFTVSIIVCDAAAPNFPAGWVYTQEKVKGRPYWIVTTPTGNWSETADLCQKAGLILGTVKTKPELVFWNAYTVKQMKQNNVKFWLAWLGGHRANASQPHSWDDNGQNINMTLFGKDQGGTQNLLQHCISLWAQVDAGTVDNPEYQGLADEYCYLKFPFICTKPGRGSFSCANRTCGPYPNPDDCSTYFVCGEDKSKVKLEKCEHGLLFNPTTFKCDYAQYVTCPTVFSCQNRTCGDYPNPSDCGTYFRCTEDKDEVIEEDCPHGLMFDSKSLKCDLPQYAVCAKNP